MVPIITARIFRRHVATFVRLYKSAETDHPVFSLHHMRTPTDSLQYRSYTFQNKRLRTRLENNIHLPLAGDRRGLRACHVAVWKGKTKRMH